MDRSDDGSGHVAGAEGGTLAVGLIELISASAAYPLRAMPSATSIAFGHGHAQFAPSTRRAPLPVPIGSQPSVPPACSRSRPLDRPLGGGACRYGRCYGPGAFVHQTRHDIRTWVLNSGSHLPGQASARGRLEPALANTEPITVSLQHQISAVERGEGRAVTDGYNRRAGKPFV
jgi:hypothetical protein